jgi:hypothetical protein
MNIDQLEEKVSHQLHQLLDPYPAPSNLEASVIAKLERQRSSDASRWLLRLHRPHPSRRLGATAVGLVTAVIVGGIIAASFALNRQGTSGQQALGNSPSPTVSSASALPTPTNFVPWLALAARGIKPQAPEVTPSPPLAVVAGTPPCRAGQVEGVEVPGGAATGHEDEHILLRNRSGVACFLQGYLDISILDSKGRVLASAVGSADRSTFFDYGLPVLPVLLKPGTPPFGSPTNFQITDPGEVGQAWMNVEWYQCHPSVQAVEAALQLPDSGGRLLVPFALQSPYSPDCDTTASTYTFIGRGPLQASGYVSAQQPAYQRDSISIDAPDTVKAGSTLTYYVTIHNDSSKAYDLALCPDYTEMLGAKQAVEEYQLNCSHVGAIDPGDSATFQMELAIPSTLPAGASTLTWGLIDGRLSNSTATAPITIAS